MHGFVLSTQANPLYMRIFEMELSAVTTNTSITFAQIQDLRYRFLEPYVIMSKPEKRLRTNKTPHNPFLELEKLEPTICTCIPYPPTSHSVSLEPQLVCQLPQSIKA
jgi:hypothetical protein